MKWLTEKGFTLVELMIVIAIIGILAVALTTQVTKMQDAARAAKCKANLRALAQAAHNYGVDEGKYPAAGSFEYEDAVTEKGPIYQMIRGWVAWTQGSSGALPWGDEDKSTGTSFRGTMAREKYYGETAYFSLTNGALWQLLGKDVSIYVCGAHKSVAQSVLKEKVYRSYVMSGCFGYSVDWSQKKVDPNAKLNEDQRKEVGDVIGDGRAARRLMFAELPGEEGEIKDKRNDSDFTDSVLPYCDWDKEEKDRPQSLTKESIGFNHLVARRWVGHIAFIDGHVEGLVLPNGAKKGMYPSYGHPDLIDLTEQLCNAQEIEHRLRETMQ